MVEGATLDDFTPESVLRLAVERAIELIGEAARRVSAEFRAQNTEIPWRDIIGQRNVIAHEYGEVDPRRLWQTALHDTRALIEVIDTLLAAESDEAGSTGEG